MSQAITHALRELDPANDEHWTKQGLPQVAVVANLSGVLTLTRAELNGIAPDFNRETAQQYRESFSITSSSQPDPSDREPETGAPGAPDLSLDDEGEGIEEGVGDQAEDEHPAQLPADLRKQTLDAIHGELHAIRKEIAMLRAREDDLIRLSDQIVTEGVPENSELENQLGIMNWIEAQNVERQQRAERQRELIALGVQPDELAGRKAPIDAAMGRNLGFGQSRPTYPQWRPR